MPPVQLSGTTSLLDVCLRNAELLWRDFGDGKRRLAPGHQIVEMGLVLLHRATGDARWLMLARIFLEARGPGGPEYNQLHQLVVDQDTAVGHAVRANYQYSAMADLAALAGDARQLGAIHKIWANVVTTKLYLTGGVGPRPQEQGEAYGDNYELPHDAYNETCAAVALMQWNQRMFLLTGKAAYVDVLERTAFNGFISGVSASGDRFSYPNPLVYDGSAKNNHGHAGRAPWFGCACCPPNLMRTLASLTGYFYAVRDARLFVNFYAQSEGAALVCNTSVTLTQTTDYPWSGTVQLTVSPETPTSFTLLARIPGWAQGHPVPTDLYAYDAPHADWRCRVSGRDVTAQPEDGYLAITREWRAGDVVELDFALPVRVVRGNPHITSTQGQVAFERGPVVYCVEGVGQSLPTAPLNTSLRAIPARAAVGLDDVVTLNLEDPDMPTLTAIPYYAWNNRGLAPMRVWLAAKP
jgi:DUF1680 family protein